MHVGFQPLERDPARAKLDCLLVLTQLAHQLWMAAATAQVVDVAVGQRDRHLIRNLPPHRRQKTLARGHGHHAGLCRRQDVERLAVRQLERAGPRVADNAAFTLVASCHRDIRASVKAIATEVNPRRSLCCPGSS